MQIIYSVNIYWKKQRNVQLKKSGCLDANQFVGVDLGAAWCICITYALII